MAIPSKISGVNLTDFLGQLLVVLNIGFSLALGTPELIPDPLCWKWRWNVQPEKSACHKTMDLGSVIFGNIMLLVG